MPGQGLVELCAAFVGDDDGARAAALAALPALLAAAAASASLAAPISQLVACAAAMHEREPVRVFHEASFSFRLAGARLDAPGLLLRVLDAAEGAAGCKRATDELVRSEGFWRIVFAGARLPSSNRGARKEATALLVRGLARLRLLEAADAVLELPRAAAAWDALLLFVDALEDFPPHLIQELWSQRAVHLFDVSGEADGADCESESECMPVPSFVRPMPFVWASLVLDRAFHHDNPTVKRQLLLGTMAEAVQSDTESRGGFGGAASAAVANASGTGRQPGVSDLRFQPLCSYVSSTVPEQAVGGPAAKLKASASVAIGFLLPTWYVSKNFIEHVADSAVFGGPTETMGRLLYDFLVAHGSFQLQQRGAMAFGRWVCALVGGLVICAATRGAVKWVARALAALPSHLRRQPHLGPLPTPLDAASLACLRLVATGSSLVHSRAFCEALNVNLLEILVGFCSPGEVPLADLGLTLALFPAALVLGPAADEAGRSRQLAISVWLQSGDSLRDPLCAACAAFVLGSDGPIVAGGPLPHSAVGLARLFVLMLMGTGPPPASFLAVAALSELSATLAGLHSRVYLSPLHRKRALLLTQALLAAAWPRGGRGDAHLSRNVLGAALPLRLHERLHPLHDDFILVLRSAAAAHRELYARASLRECDECPVAPSARADCDEDDTASLIHTAADDLCVAAAALHLQPAREAVRALLLAEAVAPELAASLEATVASGQALDVALQPRLTFCLDHGLTTRESPSVALLPVDVALSLLSELTVCLGCRAHFGDAARRTLRASLLWLEASQSSSTDVLQPAAAAAHLVMQANALHAVAILARPCAGLNADTAATVHVLLRLASAKPRGATEPALPLLLTSESVTEASDSDARWRANGLPPAGCCSEADRFVPWQSLRSLVEACRVLALGAFVQLASSSSQQQERGAGSSLLAALPPALALQLAIAIQDALEVCGSDDSAISLLGLGACVLRAAPCQGEAPEAVAAAADGLPGRVALNGPIAFESLLPGLERLVRQPKLSRRLAFAFAACVVSPPLFLREALHLPCGSEDSGPLLQLLHRAVDDFVDSRPHFALQALTARLVACWRCLVLIAEQTDAKTSGRAATSRRVLCAHVPLMVRLLLHREKVPLYEDPLLADATARAQMLAWLTSRGFGEDLLSRDSSCAPEAAAAAIETGLQQRGAGALVRVQVLCWLSELSATPAPRSVEAECESVREMLCRALLLRLVSFNLAPAISGDCSPGSEGHALKLRSWQAIAVLARPWGLSQHDDEALGYSAAFDAFCPGSFDVAVALARAEALLPSASEARKRYAALLPKPQASGTRPLADRGAAGALTAAADFAIDATPVQTADVALATLLVVFRHLLCVAQVPSTRHYLETVSVALARRYPVLASTAILFPALLNYNAGSQLAFSAILVAADLTMHVSRLLEHCSGIASARVGVLVVLAAKLVQSIAPHSTSPFGLVRVLANVTMADAIPRLYDGQGPAASCPPLGLVEWVRPQLRLLAGSADLREMALKQARHFARLAPESSCSLSVILCSPCTEHGEIVGEDAFTAIRATFQSLTAAMHVRDPSNISESDDCMDAFASAALAAGLVPRRALLDSRLRQGFGVVAEGGGPFGVDASLTPPRAADTEVAVVTQAAADRHAALVPPTHVNLQRKQLSAMHQAEGLQHTASLPPQVRPHAASLSVRDASHPLLTYRAPGSQRGYQPVIVLASFVQKAPNLAGIARTCEVLGAQALVVHDLRVLRETEFASISVGAADWLQVDECKAADALWYVRTRRLQGYSIVGLEQAARSVRLGSAACVLPDKLVLVLGAEKEGIPVALLQEVDVCVEIQQLGLIRSLNVHVSAALLLQEYTRQRCERLLR